MGKISNPKGKSISDEDDIKTPSKKSVFVFHDDSSDDEAANEDLSLKIVEKAKSRAARAAAASENGREEIITMELVASSVSTVKKMKVVKKIKKVKKIKQKQQQPAAVVVAAEVNDVRDEGNVITTKVVEGADAPQEVENPDNDVLRKLLRGPRYFDPPENSWGACFKCGEDGHSSANCTSVKRRKPCFICGSTEHTVRQCTQAQHCFICNESSHRAKDCPQKFKKCSKSSEICLKCGASGHIMIFCSNDYSPDDLKQIQCYICKSYGHLCCANYFDSTASEVSCYKCGQTGHTGPGCRTSQGNTVEVASPSVCYRCGRKGHFARECTNAKMGDTTEVEPSLCYRCGGEGHFAKECAHIKKVKKKDLGLLTPSKKPVKPSKRQRAIQSAPQDLGKKKIQFDDANFTDPRNLKRKVGWITEHPGDYSYRNPQRDQSYGYPSEGNTYGNSRGYYSHGNHYYHGNGSGDYYNGSPHGNYSYGDARRWVSPATPIRNHMVSSLSNGGYHSNSQSYRGANNYYPGYDYSQGSAGPSQHVYSASRFASSNGGGMRRGYGWR